MTRKSKPWAVVLDPGREATRTEHTSEAKAYQQVRDVAAGVKDGSSSVTRIRVEQWDRDYSRWQLFDLIDPTDF